MIEYLTFYKNATFMSHKKNEHGFTMIELLVVVAIIGMLSAAVIASVTTARMKSRDTRRLSSITAIQKALELAQSSVGYPGVASQTYVVGTGSCATGFTALSTLLVPTYIPSIAPDPLGDRCIYYIPSADGQGYRIVMQPEQSTLLAKDHDCYTPTATWYCIRYSQ